MALWGAFIGALLGWAIAREWGALLGAFLGYSLAANRGRVHWVHMDAGRARAAFFKATFLVMGCVA